MDVTFDRLEFYWILESSPEASSLVGDWFGFFYVGRIQLELVCLLHKPIQKTLISIYDINEHYP